MLRLVLTLFLCLIFNTTRGQFFSLQDSLNAPSPQWQGDTASMQFTPNGLRSNLPAAGSFTWTRPAFAGLAATWKIKTTIEFNPSSSNFAEFRFLEHGTSHYALRLGGTTQDLLSLVLHTPYKDSVLAAAPNLLSASTNSLDLRIDRDSAAQFSVFVADSLLFSTTDSTLLQATTLSLYGKCTSTRVNKFLFSTLHVQGYDFKDTIGPMLQQIDVFDPYTLQLTWNEWCQLPSSAPPYALLFSETDASRPDTLTITDHFDRFWYLETAASENPWDPAAPHPQPLPQGKFTLQLPSSEDAEGNLTFGLVQSTHINYPGPRAVAVTAIHPFDNPIYDGPFFCIQSGAHLGWCDLTLLEASGRTKHYVLPIDSGLTVFSETFISQLNSTAIPNLDLPEEGVIILQKDGITLAVQPFQNLFQEDQLQGDYLLQASSFNYTSEQFAVAPANTWQPTWCEESTLPPLKLLGQLAPDPSANPQSPVPTFVHFDRNLFPYLDTLRSLGLAHPPFTPLAPFIMPFSPALMALLSTPTSLVGTTAQLLSSSPPVQPDSAQLYLSEVHFQPASTTEFVELYNSTNAPLFLHRLQLTRTSLPVPASSSSYSNAALLPIQPAAYNASNLVLLPLIPPQSYLALPAPFSLPNAPNQISLLAPFGTLLDLMRYDPERFQAPMSAERISFETSALDSLNWAPHHPSWSTPTSNGTNGQAAEETTEASPDAQNSVFQQPGTASPHSSAELTHPTVSYDPQNFRPTTQLRLRVVAGTKCSLTVHAFSGHPISTIADQAPLGSGEHLIEIRPSSWTGAFPPSGTYVLRLILSTSSGSSLQHIPISIYNP